MRERLGEWERGPSTTGRVVLDPAFGSSVESRAGAAPVHVPCG